MENKPVFCSACGARLTGSAAFCASCGAKQAAVLAPDVSAPVQAAPAAVPVNSLAAPKAKLSAFALVMTLLALGATFLAAVLDIAYNIVAFGAGSFDATMRVLQINGTGMLMAWVAPLLAMVMVLTRNKKLAMIGLILALVSLALQFLMSIIYAITIMNGGNLASLSFVLRPLNGEMLFFYLYRLLRGSIPGPLWLNLFASLMYWLKNILAAVGCLVVVVKKQK